MTTEPRRLCMPISPNQCTERISWNSERGSQGARARLTRIHESVIAGNWRYGRTEFAERFSNVVNLTWIRCGSCRSNLRFAFEGGQFQLQGRILHQLGS